MFIEPLTSPDRPAIPNRGINGEFLAIARDVVHVRDRANSGTWFQGQLSIAQAWRALVAALYRSVQHGRL